MASGKKVEVFPGHDNWVTGVALLPDGKRALSVSDDGTVWLWDLVEGEALERVDVGDSGDVPCCVALSPDGRSFLVGTADGVVLRFGVGR